MCVCVFSVGLAEEALTAGPRKTETDGEAAEHLPQQTLLWVTHTHTRDTRSSYPSFASDLRPVPRSGGADISERQRGGERRALPQAEGPARHSGEGDHGEAGPDGAVQQGAAGQWSRGADGEDGEDGDGCCSGKIQSKLVRDETGRVASSQGSSNCNVVDGDGELV